ncbi:hypothetical protein K431DRAFT_323022 [Polychaeton citri CBS 116435]|uniref:non-specific serine/threonine protein kinase n=1 Tax=Polychaeton citri CBS 116435 TaxID=1314669 RepID=A0A9P4Q3T2_9PEZI|nr:hypothetical protein K431DRAFT_323022 [Polychaeton citri CBS 116435]
MAVQPHTFPTYGFPLLPTETKFEEERLTGYKADDFYPVRFGEVFRSKYQVVAKLGFGTASTVWLCRDLRLNQTQEVAISEHSKFIDAEHSGKSYLRVALEDFHERALERTLLQKFLLVIAGVVHTADDLAMSKVEHAEFASPSPRKVLLDRTIHLFYAMPTTYDPPVITDFDAARLREPGQKHSGDVMPGNFRAPEIAIWSIGVMDGDLFNHVRHGHLDDELHFAQMVSLMEPPPKQFLERSDRCLRYSDPEGNQIATTSIPSQTLESREIRLQGKDGELLLVLVRKILKWLPEKTDDFIIRFMSELSPLLHRYGKPWGC